MEPLFWPITAPGPSHFTKVNADGSIALPEPYKPKYLNRSPKAKPVSGQLTRAQALEIIEDSFNKFESEILEAINNQLNTKKKMNTTTNAALSEKEALLNKLNSMSKKINVALAKSKGSIRAGTFFTADGTLLDFGEKVNEFSDIQVGTTATIDGKPASGEHTMPDGKVLIFEKGKLTDIKGMVKSRSPFKAKRKPTGKRVPFHKPL